MEILSNFFYYSLKTGEIYLMAPSSLLLRPWHNGTIQVTYHLKVLLYMTGEQDAAGGEG